MNIDKVLGDLFRPQASQDKCLNQASTNGRKIDPSQLELSKLQTQMHQFAVKERKKYTPFFNFSDNTTYDPECMDELINQEITRSQVRNKSWKTIPKSSKWELVCAYFEKDDVRSIYDTDTISKMKAQMKNDIIAGKCTNVKYDNVNAQITQIM